jgi:hypothetical protein
MNNEAIRHDTPTATATPAAGKRGDHQRHVLGLDVDRNCGFTVFQSATGLEPAQQRSSLA